jgi:hypothetical protein
MCGLCKPFDDAVWIDGRPLLIVKAGISFDILDSALCFGLIPGRSRRRFVIARAEGVPVRKALSQGPWRLLGPVG